MEKPSVPDVSSSHQPSGTDDLDEVLSASGHQMSQDDFNESLQNAMHLGKAIDDNPLENAVPNSKEASSTKLPPRPRLRDTPARREAKGKRSSVRKHGITDQGALGFQQLGSPLAAPEQAEKDVAEAERPAMISNPSMPPPAVPPRRSSDNTEHGNDMNIESDDVNMDEWTEEEIELPMSDQARRDSSQIRTHSAEAQEESDAYNMSAPSGLSVASSQMSDLRSEMTALRSQMAVDLAELKTSLNTHQTAVDQRIRRLELDLSPPPGVVAAQQSQGMSSSGTDLNQSLTPGTQQFASQAPSEVAPFNYEEMLEQMRKRDAARKKR